MNRTLIYIVALAILASCGMKKEIQSMSIDVDSLATKEVKIGYLIDRKELTNAGVVITEIEYVPDVHVPATVVIDTVGTLKVEASTIVGIKHTAVNYTSAKDTHKDTHTEEHANVSLNKIENIRQSEMVSSSSIRSFSWVWLLLVTTLLVGGVLIYIGRIPIIAWIRKGFAKLWF